MKFFFQDNTVMLEFPDRNMATNKIDMVTAILYGAVDNISFLLKGFLKRNLKRGIFTAALCPKEFAEEVLGVGFKHAQVWNGKHNVVVLFTKKFQEK